MSAANIIFQQEQQRTSALRDQQIWSAVASQQAVQQRPSPWHSFSWLEEELTQAGLTPEQVDAALAIRRANEAKEYAERSRRAQKEREEENELLLALYHYAWRNWSERPWWRFWAKEPKRPTDRYGNAIPYYRPYTYTDDALPEQ